MPKKIKYRPPRHRSMVKRPYKTKLHTSINVERAERILKRILAVGALGVLIFVGYSIARPIINFFTEKKNAPPPETETAWTPPPETTVTTEKQTTVTTAAKAQEQKDILPEDKTNIMAYALTVGSYDDTDALKEELTIIKDSGFNTVVMTMKDENGYFYYNTVSPYADMTDSGNIRSELTAKELADIFKECGLIPAAKISVLKDSAYYGAESGMSYQTESGGIWTDKAGKPWLSPYSHQTADYVTQITSELAEAGFRYIICSDIAYPELEKDDYSSIGEALAFGDRYTALVKIFNTAYDTAAAQGSEVIIQINSRDAVGRSAEVFRPDELKCRRVALMCDDDNMRDISMTDPAWGGMRVIPCYAGGDPETALHVFIDNGFRESVIY